MDLRNERCYDLADAVGEAIEIWEEQHGMDTKGVLSTLGFVTAMVCVSEDGISDVEAARHFSHEFRHHLQSVGAVQRAVFDPLAVALTAGPDPSRDHPDLREGIRRGGDVLDVLRDAPAAVALIAMQSALAEKILSLAVDHEAVATGCANGVREEVLRRTPWNVASRSERVH